MKVRSREDSADVFVIIVIRCHRRRHRHYCHSCATDRKDAGIGIPGKPRPGPGGLSAADSVASSARKTSTLSYVVLAVR